MAEIYLSLGSNLGDRYHNLQQAIELLRKYIAVRKVSSIYETEPMGDEDQGWFLNLVLSATTTLLPRELLQATQGIEQEMGRIKTRINGPRNIDIDILLYDDLVLQESDLILPHPRTTKRAFVMMPLLEIAPELRFQEQDLAFLLSGLQEQGIRVWYRFHELLQDPAFHHHLQRTRQKESNRIYCNHDLDHLMSVARIAWIINLETKAGFSKELVYTTALLHDLGRWQEYETGVDHAEASAILAAELLDQHGFLGEEKERILTAIRNHRSKAAADRLSQILYEADKASRLCIGCSATSTCKRIHQNGGIPTVQY